MVLLNVRPLGTKNGLEPDEHFGFELALLAIFNTRRSLVSVTGVVDTVSVDRRMLQPDLKIKVKDDGFSLFSAYYLKAAGSENKLLT